MCTVINEPYFPAEQIKAEACMEINHLTIRQYCSVSKSLKPALKCGEKLNPIYNIRVENPMDALQLLSSE